MKLTIQQALQQGVTAHKEGKLQDAERLYRAILQSQPKQPYANHNLGVIAVFDNKTAAALPLFKIALEANPKVGQFWLSYIDALIKEKQFENAKLVIEQAKTQGVAGDELNILETKTASINKQETVGSLSPSPQQLSSLFEHYQNGRVDDAENLAISITHDFPKHPFAWKVLGAVLAATGRTSESVDAKQTVVALSPQDAEAHRNLGNTLHKLGRLEEAEISLLKAVELNPNDAAFHYTLGNTLLALDKLAAAATSYIKAIDLKSDYTESLNNLIHTLTELHSQNTKEDILKTAIAIFPGSMAVYAKAVRNLGFEKNPKFSRRIQKILRVFSCNLNFEIDYFLHKYLTEKNIVKYRKVKSTIGSQDRFPDEDFLIFEKINILSMRVLNIGALHGATSFYMDHLGASEIYSVEPNHLYWDALSCLELRNHKILPFALSNRSGKATLYSPLASRGQSSLVHIPHDKHDRLEINLRTIDELNLGYFDFWKIDVEGSELDVLKGGLNTLRNNCPDFLQVEFWENDFEEIKDFLSPFFKFTFACTVDANFKLRLIPYQKVPKIWKTINTKIVLFSRNDTS